jgi:hypothetical protein
MELLLGNALTRNKQRILAQVRTCAFQNPECDCL